MAPTPRAVCFDDRTGPDRLELLQALIAAPSFDPIFRDDVITLPYGHPVYLWWCSVPGCNRARAQHPTYCANRSVEWQAHLEQLGEEATKATFLAAVQPLQNLRGFDPSACRICPQRPTYRQNELLCFRHSQKWRSCRHRDGGDDDLAQWAARQERHEGYGHCVVRICNRLAASPTGLCFQHQQGYRIDGAPGGARLPTAWIRRYEARGLPVPVGFDNATAFQRWCRTAEPVFQVNQINLVGLRPLAKAEIQWGLDRHGRQANYTNWFASAIRLVPKACCEYDANSLADLDLNVVDPKVRMIVAEILNRLRPVYYTKSDSREAGFIQTEHFGRRFAHAETFFDLSGIPQRWLRDLIWDDIAARLSITEGLRTRASFDAARRAGLELGAFLEVDAPASRYSTPGSRSWSWNATGSWSTELSRSPMTAWWTATRT